MYSNQEKHITKKKPEKDLSWYVKAEVYVKRKKKQDFTGNFLKMENLRNPRFCR